MVMADENDVNRREVSNLSRLRNQPFVHNNSVQEDRICDDVDRTILDQYSCVTYPSYLNDADLWLKS